MKVVKGILFGVVAVIVLILLVALFVPGDFSIVREVTIKAPKAEVFDYIKYVKNQDNFGVWAKMDPNMKKEYRGTDGTVGFVSAWDSDHENVGQGEQEITGITEGERVDLELRFRVPFETTNKAYFTTTAVDSATTQVAWGFSGEMPYPMNLMLLIWNLDENAGADLEKGLANLKAILEQ